MQRRLNTLLSESNYRQQDLMTIKDDLGTLKFGLAILQNFTTDPLAVYSTGETSRLQDLMNILSIQSSLLSQLVTQFERHDIAVFEILNEIIDVECPTPLPD